MRTFYKVLLMMSLFVVIITSFWFDRGNTSYHTTTSATELHSGRQQNVDQKKHAEKQKGQQVGSSPGDSNEEESVTDCSRKLHEAEALLSRMKTENSHKSQDARKEITDSDSKSVSCLWELKPSLAYETTRRKVENGVTEVWNYMKQRLNQLRNVTGDHNRTNVEINQILKHSGDQLRSIMRDVYNLSQIDGYSSWRQNESKKLSDLIQQRLHFLQNPKNCNKAKKILCNFAVECGLGCQVHHVSYCMIMAYGTGRTLIVESKGWAYAKEGWEKFFLPLSETCRDRQGQITKKWGALDSIKDIDVVELPIIGYLPQDQRPDFLPLAIPEDISERVRTIHSFPGIWWISEILAYIMRPQPEVQELIQNKTSALGFIHPIVGIQVRRTDKINWEAKFHGIEEYMFHAEKFYQELEKSQEVPVRRIFLATDEVNLLSEAQKKYPNYVFVSDHTITQSANKLSSRFTEESLKGIIVDIHLLAMSDFLVCTFSSNVGRLAYEMMQGYHVDASSKVRSLDGDYYFHGQSKNSRNKTAKMPLYEEAENLYL